MIYLLSLIYFLFFILFYFLLDNVKIKIIFTLSGFITYVICVFGLYVNLPFSGADAQFFERLAWRWSRGSFSDVLSTFDVSRSYLISSITAFFYYFAGREPIIPIVINGVLGLFIMYYSIKLFDEVWGQYEKRKHRVASISKSSQMKCCY